MCRNMCLILVLGFVIAGLASSGPAVGAEQLASPAAVAGIDSAPRGDSPVLGSQAMLPTKPLPWQQKTSCTGFKDCILFICNCGNTCGACGIQTVTCNVAPPRLSYQCICNSPC
jgi:hypothetical protein